MKDSGARKRWRKRVRGTLIITCPRCRKATKTRLGQGWAVTHCPACGTWFRTSNEVLTLRLLRFYGIKLPTDKPSGATISTPAQSKKSKSTKSRRS